MFLDCYFPSTIVLVSTVSTRRDVFAVKNQILVFCITSQRFPSARASFLKRAQLYPRDMEYCLLELLTRCPLPFDISNLFSQIEQILE